MPKLIVVNTAGKEMVLEGQAGRSLMEIMRDNGVDDLQALCGGSCSCATCHVWVDPGFVNKLTAISGQESDMLDCVADRRENSRLSCQLKMTEALSGIRVTIAPP